MLNENNNSSDEKLRKQSYLRNEILNKGYDGQNFFYFLIEQKGEEGGDINNWTINELQKVVESFKEKVKKEMEENDINNENYINNSINEENNGDKKNNIQNESSIPETPAKLKQEKNYIQSSDKSIKSNVSCTGDVPPPACGGSQQLKSSEKSKNSKIIYSNSKSNKSEAYPTHFYNEESKNTWEFLSECAEQSSREVKILEILCLEPDQSPFSQYEKLTPKVSGPEKLYEKTGLFGFFSNKLSYSFQIKIREINLITRRTYSDFLWLRNTLLKLYPGNYIPPFNMINNFEQIGNNEKLLDRLIKNLERFLMELLNDILFKNSSVLYIFLKTENEKHFEDVKNKFENVQAPVDLKQFRSRNGKLVLRSDIFDKNIQTNTSQNYMENFEKVKENIIQNTKLIENLNNSFKNLFKEMKIVSERMKEISEIFKSIYKLSVTYSEDQKLFRTYASLENLFRSLGEATEKNSQFVQEHLKVPLNYVGLQYSISLSELEERFEYYQRLFLRVNDELKRKKEKLFKSKEISKWDLDPKDEQFDFDDPYISFQKMLPKETYYVNEIKLHFIYYATQLLEEFKRVKGLMGDENLEILKNFVTNFKELENKKMTLFESILKIAL